MGFKYGQAEIDKELSAIKKRARKSKPAGSSRSKGDPDGLEDELKRLKRRMKKKE